MQPRFGEWTWITPYGLMLALALLAGYLLARRRAAARGIDTSHVDLSVPLLFAIGVIGSRLPGLLSPGDTAAAGELLRAQSRYRLFGILLLSLPALYLYCRLARLSCRRMLDLYALPAILWLAILRCGCFLAGCCWGDLSGINTVLAGVRHTAVAAQVQTVPWLTGDWILTAVRFPAGSLPHRQHVLLGLIGADAPASLPVHPVQLYELALLACLFLLLHRTERYFSTGTTALAGLAGYALLRFLLEYLRADNALVFGNVTAPQLMCAGVLSGCLCCLLYFSRRTPADARTGAGIATIP